MSERAPQHRFDAAVVVTQEPLTMVRVEVVNSGQHTEFRGWRFEWFDCGHGSVFSKGYSTTGYRWCRLCSSAQK